MPIPKALLLVIQGAQRLLYIRLSQQALADASDGGSIQVVGDRISLSDGSKFLIQNQEFQGGGVSA